MIETLLLGAGGSSNLPVGSIVIWSLVLVALVVGAWIVLMAVRNRTLSEPTYGGGVGLSLSEIRTMKARGEIDDEEFESLRRVALQEAGVAIDGGEGPESELKGSAAQEPGGTSAPGESADDDSRGSLSDAETGPDTDRAG